MTNNISKVEKDMKYLKLLSNSYPNIQSASTEIINLESILNLPKSTEHFLTDIHGEYEAFNHVLKNGSGNIKRKIGEVFEDSLSKDEINQLATIIYYPKEKLELIKKEKEDLNTWYKITINRLIKVCRKAAFKYTRMKVKKALPKDFEYIIEELMYKGANEEDKAEYYDSIVNTIISINRSEAFIIAMSELIQRLVIDQLHIIGDIYDRGPGAEIVMDTLMNYHSVDIQWGNHDVLWMGAAAGNEACIATVIRICLRYLNLSTLEDGYGINLLPLASLAMEVYGDDPCDNFVPKNISQNKYNKNNKLLITKMHKAISIIQFKLEGLIIKRNPYFNMDDRLVLDKINFNNNTIELYGKNYNLSDSFFPTIDPNSPYELTESELEVINKLKNSFLSSYKLQEHTKFLFNHGSMYLISNSNLLYHGCIPMNNDCSFKKVNIDSSNKLYYGKNYFDELEKIIRKGYFKDNKYKDKIYALDMFWYLWTGPNSPLFGKDKMTTFERYFISDKSSHKEIQDPYFKLEHNINLCNIIFDEFNLDPDSSHIINGHVPVKEKKGESPIRAGGKLLAIDGGFSKAYQNTTGIAGYTLIYNSYGLILASHKPFESTEKAIKEEKDLHSTTIVLEKELKRKKIRDTDEGKKIIAKIDDIKNLLSAYRSGLINQRE